MSDESEATPIRLERIDCPLCDSLRYRRQLRQRDVLHGIEGVFEVVRCLDCGHLYMNPRPAAESLPLCYPISYGPHREQNEVTAGEDSEESAGVHEPDVKAGQRTRSSSGQDENRPWYLRRGVRSIPGLRSLYYWLSDAKSEFIPQPPAGDSVAVELGCATGEFLGKLHGAGWQVIGVELVSSAAETARKRGFDVRTGSLSSTGLPENSFDAAFAWMVLEHLPEPRTELEQFHRLLRHNGWLAVSVPNAGCWERAVFGSDWYVWELPRHLHYFRPRTLKRLLEDTGFHQIQVVHQRNLLNVVGSIGRFFRRSGITSKFGRFLMKYPDQPRLWCELATAPLAIFLAKIRQGGRLTVIARCHKPDAEPAPADDSHQASRKAPQDDYQ